MGRPGFHLDFASQILELEDTAMSQQISPLGKYSKWEALRVNPRASVLSGPGALDLELASDPTPHSWTA